MKFMHKIQKLIKLLLPLAFGFGIVWFILQKVDTRQLVDTIQSGISWTWVIISWALALLANVFRGIRWRQQLRTVGIDPSLHDMSVSFFGNYGMNLVFPRLGEVWRCNYIANSSDKPFSTVAGTILSERLCDILSMLVYLVLCMIFESHVLIRFFFGDEEGNKVDVETSYSLWVWMIGIVAVCLLVWFLLNRYCKDWAPYRYVCDVLRNVWVGFRSLKDLPNIWSYIGWSMLIWFFYFLNTLTQFYFFDFTTHLGLNACLAVFVMGSLAQILPIQGGLGAWQIMVIFALMLYGISESDAGIFSVVAWTLEQLFVLVMGLYALIYVAIKKQKNA